MFRPLVATLAAFIVSATAFTAQADTERDPFRSPIWADLHETELGGAPVVYDNSVFLAVPDEVLDAANVPVLMKFTKKLGEVREIALFAEHNPIQSALRIYPHRPLRSVGFNIRLEQSTPVRAAVLDGEGVWHVASKRVFVAVPGGCSALPPGGGSEIGEIAVKQFDRAGGASRVKVKINHPMHTGFAATDEGDIVPAYYLDRITIADETGPIADMTTWAALSSDPVFILDLPERQQSIRVSAHDSAGLAFETLLGASSM